MIHDVTRVPEHQITGLMPQINVKLQISKFPIFKKTHDKLATIYILVITRSTRECKTNHVINPVATLVKLPANSIYFTGKALPTDVVHDRFSYRYPSSPLSS